MEMFRTLAKAWKKQDIRHKMIFTLLMMIVYRLGANIPVPGINREVLSKLFDGGGGIFELFNLFSGGAFSQMTIFALSITPYITASIILQLLTIAIPKLETLAKEGGEGQKKIAQYTRYLTVVLSLVQAIGITYGVLKPSLNDTGTLSIALVVVVLTAGTSFLMWLGEQINQYGIGNGISLLIFAGIIARMPTMLQGSMVKYEAGEVDAISIGLFLLFAVVIIVGIIMIQEGQRRVPVQYAKRVVGRKMYGGQSSHIPMKVNQAGVIPVIFSMAFLQTPLTFMHFWPNSAFGQWAAKWMSPSGSPGVWVYAIADVLLILFFTYFYTAVSFNPLEIAQNMKANGGFVPGIRPGKTTVEYLNRVMTRITFVGAVFLAAISILPTILSQSMGLSIHFGGTSLLIAVGVALDTMKQIENHMLMRDYQGFLR